MRPALIETPGAYRQILGINFFTGAAKEAVDRMSHGGGLLVVPAAPALNDLSSNQGYREALLNADLVITDSALMVLLWNLLESDTIPRVSGLAYLRELLGRPEIQAAGRVFWIMPSRESAGRCVAWLGNNKIQAEPADVYVAPFYGGTVIDDRLLEQLRIRRPAHVVIALGGGTQERLGLYIKRNLNYRPAIHCIGAAIAFLTGDQVYIPVWSDRLYLGWLFRCLSEPRRYVVRYWRARKLVSLLIRYRSTLPIEEAV